jgi:hypothetical protein
MHSHRLPPARDQKREIRVFRFSNFCPGGSVESLPSVLFTHSHNQVRIEWLVTLSKLGLKLVTKFCLLPYSPCREVVSTHVGMLALGGKFRWNMAMSPLATVISVAGPCGVKIWIKILWFCFSIAAEGEDVVIKQYLMDNGLMLPYNVEYQAGIDLKEIWEHLGL